MPRQGVDAGVGLPLTTQNEPNYVLQIFFVPRPALGYSPYGKSQIASFTRQAAQSMTHVLP